MPLLYIRATKLSINAANNTITIIVSHFSINTSNKNNMLLPTLIGNIIINILFLYIVITYSITSLYLGIRYVAIRSSNRFNPLKIFSIDIIINNARFTHFVDSDNKYIISIFISLVVIRTLL